MLRELFVEYETRIRAIFDRIVGECQFSDGKTPRLEFTEVRTIMLFRCVPSRAIVQVDWRGIASLWAISQAVGRLCRAMFDARRRGLNRLNLPEGSEQLLGYQFIEYAKQLSEPQDWRWNGYFPMPQINADSEEAKSGDFFFFRSLEWILRHEIGHIFLQHADHVLIPTQSRAEEMDADLFATRSLKNQISANPGAEAAANTFTNEFERCALAAGISLIWIALFEDGRAPASHLYPPITDRLFRSLEEFNLGTDSAALEILSDFIKAWIDPVEEWPARSPAEATARAAMDHAFASLNEYARKLKSKLQ